MPKQKKKKIPKIRPVFKPEDEIKINNLLSDLIKEINYDIYTSKYDSIKSKDPAQVNENFCLLYFIIKEHIDLFTVKPIVRRPRNSDNGNI